MSNITALEKFLGVLNFDTSVPVPRWEFGYWYDTLVRWYHEGLPRNHPPILPAGAAQFIGAEVCAGFSSFENKPTADYDAHVHFEFDERIHSLPVIMNPVPAYPVQVLKEDGENLTIRDGNGKTIKTRKDGTSMPMFLDYPVKCRNSFKEYASRFNAETQERIVAPPDTYRSYYEHRTFPLQIGGSHFSGFFSVLRESLGLEETLFALCDEPDFMHEMLEFFTDYYIKLYQRVLSLVKVDYVLIWEDMCYKNGPLISPAFFKEFCSPYYIKFIDAMKKLDIKHFIVDTDGNCDALIPLFIETGVTGIYPFEVAAGMDIEKIRAEYSDLVIIGGIDKRALARGESEIDGEVRKVERMLKSGGFLPCVDHAVTPDISFHNYCYFRSRIDSLLGE